MRSRVKLWMGRGGWGLAVLIAAGAFARVGAERASADGVTLIASADGNGPVSVLRVEASARRPVFNLSVEEGHTYFVGASGSLVHNVSRCNPVPASEGEVFRGTSTPPEEVFERGFRPRGSSDDLGAHALDPTDPPSGFVPTSASEGIARGFTRRNGGGYVYRVRNRGRGIDVNKTLGQDSPAPFEREVAFPEGIDPADIIGAQQVDASGAPVGDFIPNPNYVP